MAKNEQDEHTIDYKGVVDEIKDKIVEGDVEKDTTPEPIIKPNLDVDAMLSEITESMQEPSPDLVVNEVQGETPEDVFSDAVGDLWDKTKHSMGSDGQPVYTAKGLFRKRRAYRGRATDDTAEEKASRKVAEYSAVAFTQVGVAVFGEEWQPIINDSENEKEFLTGAFDDYYKAKDIADIPPGLALCIALGGYSIRRIGKPQTKGRLAKVKEWFVAKVERIRYGKVKKKKPVDT